MANTFQLGIIATIGGEPCANFLQWQTPFTTGSPVTPYLADLLATFGTALLPQFLACLPNDYLIKGVQARMLTGGSSYTLVGYTTLVNGTRPAHCSGSGIGPLLVISPISPPSARTLKKIYFAGSAVGDLTDNTWSADLVTALNSFLLDFLTPIVGTYTWTPVVHSKKFANSYPLLLGYISQKPALQRRRFLPVGG